MKTSRPSAKRQRIARFYDSMTRMGFTYGETEILRRAQMTLHRWAERECNGEVERDEETGKTYAVYDNGRCMVRTATPDRETGALKRIRETVDIRNAREAAASEYKTREALPNLVAYHQTDPRGCALYLVEGSPIDDVSSYYSRGFAVCI